MCASTFLCFIFLFSVLDASAVARLILSLVPNAAVGSPEARVPSRLNWKRRLHENTETPFKASFYGSSSYEILI